MSVISMKQLLEAGVHFGHQTRRWNPKMAPYIYTERNGIYIIDLQKSVGKVDEAYKAVSDIAAAGGTILFVGTKKQAQDAIKTEAERCGMFYVNERWLGGMLTNFRTIQSRIARLKEIETMATDGTFEVLPKKEVIALKKEWEKLIPKENVVSGEYILYYSLGQDKENIELVEEISKKMKLPVITTRYSGRNELFTNFKRIYDVGPVEFLNLLSNAKLVLTTSFHGTIFSVILNTPFFSINADKDYRRLTLLKTMGLETRNINKNNMEEKLKNAFEINFENSNSKIKNEKEKSIEYLRKALEIGE